jgi:3-oxoacyl-[acyl-carrier protein] reductase
VKSPAPPKLRSNATRGPHRNTRGYANRLLEKPADKDDYADMAVTACRTGTMTGQTMVIDSGRYFH